jgi:hypothetical protein
MIDSSGCALSVINTTNIKKSRFVHHPCPALLMLPPPLRPPGKQCGGHSHSPRKLSRIPSAPSQQRFSSFLCQPLPAVAGHLSEIPTVRIPPFQLPLLILNPHAEISSPDLFQRRSSLWPTISQQHPANPVASRRLLVPLHKVSAKWRVPPQGRR